MKYVSTRGGMNAQAFSDILLEGLAPDGGLAVPESIPQVSAQTLETWRTLPYHALATEVCLCSSLTLIARHWLQ